jgi:hypothetical protein
MPMLSDEQREYLLRHKIPASVVFDATGLRRKEWQSQMKQLGLRFAFGVGPCKKGNHSLRSAGGNCIQCEPANIAFANRNYDDGHVYIAYSMEEVLLKVGVAKSVKKRINSLNSLGYAGATDWKVLHSIKVKKAGEVEFSIHADLASYHVSVTYLRDGNPVDCREVFRCDVLTALNTFDKNTGAKSKVDEVANEIVQLFLTENTEDVSLRGPHNEVAYANPIGDHDEENDDHVETWLQRWRGEEKERNFKTEPWLRVWRGEADAALVSSNVSVNEEEVTDNIEHEGERKEIEQWWREWDVEEDVEAPEDQPEDIDAEESIERDDTDDQQKHIEPWLRKWHGEDIDEADEGALDREGGEEPWIRKWRNED